MITNANAAAPAQTRPEFEIKDSLLGDALERNELTLPPRLMHPPLSDHLLGKPADTGNVSAP